MTQSSSAETNVSAQLTVRGKKTIRAKTMIKTVASTRRTEPQGAPDADRNAT